MPRPAEIYQKDQICPVCGKSANVTDGTFARIVKCEKCGLYYIEDDVIDDVKDFSVKYRLRACLYFYLTQHYSANHLKGIIPHFHKLNDNDIVTNEISNHNLISIDSIMDLYPQDVNERITKSLLNLGKEVKYIGNTFFIDKLLYKILFFTDESYGPDTLNDQIDGMKRILMDSGYIEFVSTTLYTLTTKGWAFINEYQKENEIIPQAFIAMWFDDQMKPAKETIIKAIENSGYFARIISDKEHNNQIVPEIFYEIKRSSFIIADLTGNRGGVYYEAGYAEALSKPVIATCHADSFNDRHFDVAQKNTIKWETEKDLYKSLMSRIEATVGKRK